MTVAELLDRIIGGYSGATPEAMRTFKPVFYARLKHREGEALDEAANVVLGSFKPSSRQPFPIPADFEAHLPNIRRDMPADDGPIRHQIEARAERSRRLFSAWFAEQGRRIKAARHPSVYGACVLEVMDLCRKADERTQRIILSAGQIALCEKRALSAERAHRGPPLDNLSNEAWQAQIDGIRAEWAAPRSKAA